MGVSPLKPPDFAKEPAVRVKEQAGKAFLPQKPVSPANSSQNAVSANANTGGITRLNQVLLSLGLPRDSLGRALLIFSRFFSLPLNQAKLTELRREVFNAAANAAGEHPDSSKDGEKDLLAELKRLKNENRALAAAAALDKGVVLSPRALNLYALDIMDGEDVFKEDGADDEGSGTENSGGNPGKGGGDREKEQEKSADDLKRSFERFMDGKNGNRLLNRLPGKNGQHWIVWPFVMEGPPKLKVMLRVLTDEPPSTGRLILDAAGQVNRWRFILNKSKETLKADISVFPEHQNEALEALKREAETLLAVFGPAEIRINNGNLFPSLDDDFLTGFFAEELLPSINTKV